MFGNISDSFVNNLSKVMFFQSLTHEEMYKSQVLMEFAPKVFSTDLEIGASSISQTFINPLSQLLFIKYFVRFDE